jgi:putative SOS response-associated peptidase YedK
VPPWADDPTMGSRLINARGETIASKPSFRDGFRHRRAIVPVRAFYEWASIGRRRIPHAIRADDDGILGFAAIWSHAAHVPQGPLETFAIVTTAANERLRPIHDRMPVVLDSDDRRRWLDHRPDGEGGPSSEELQAMLRACGDERLRTHPVSTRVNRPVEDGAGLLEPVSLETDVENATRGRSEPPGLFDMEA